MNSRWTRLGSYRAAAVLWLLACLASCATGNYQGDGELVDRGPLVGTDRYVVNLGGLDLGKTGQFKYMVGNLPPVPFVVGLEIVEEKPNFPRKRPQHAGRVRLMLETEEGQKVFSEDARLSDWVWSFVDHEARSFLFRVGKRGRPLPDQASGSTFVPRSGAKYRLTLEVVEPQSSPRPARLLLKGGGWQ